MRVIRKPEVLEAFQVKDLLNSPDAWPERLEREYLGFGDPVVTTRHQFLASHYTAISESWLLVSESGVSVCTNSYFGQRFERVDPRPNALAHMQKRLVAAWNLISMVHWPNQPAAWQEAAGDWRDYWHLASAVPGKVGLTFDDLRAANIKRIPLFKNRKGVVVHKPDGSDLSVAEWFRNLMGEMGEFAGWHKKWQLGEIDDATYKKESAKELADIQTYLDILAFRVGVDLGEATRQKFNEVSERFGCEVRL